MKANAPKRKIFDAVDMMTADTAEAEIGNGLQSLPIDKIKPFHDHPFHLYEGERLDDMVESIREHGVLAPVIVRKKGRGFEMLSGHNRLNAAKIAGLTEIPAIVKDGLSDEEAYVYVIETNVIQRSFADLAPSEAAAVLSARYEKVISQGRRNDILHEIEAIGTCGHDVHKSRSRDDIGEEYGMTGRNIARYMRADRLIRPFKDRLDAGELTLTAAVELSYLPEDEQTIVAEKGAAVNEKAVKAIRAAAGELTEEKLEEILHPAKASALAKAVSVKISAEAGEKYFSGMNAKERTDLVMKALDAWFAGKEAAHVQ
ncbi:MAG: ParB/RepB/Spo0J family partition protein [Lachnospiraceae bacterium]|nr:ParB/RepB/Spo0J family partition protein [Muribaculaceae bacterium]MCM1411070.1 ParB/RepB/Spo0J family partition protein [Lachnospiraceae bacterium]